MRYKLPLTKVHAVYPYKIATIINDIIVTITTIIKTESPQSCDRQSITLKLCYYAWLPCYLQ